MQANSNGLGIEQTPPVPPLHLQRQLETPADRKALGRAARSRVPRQSHSAWSAPADRTDPIALLEAHARTLAPELAPIRFVRMLSSPFAFYRGAAAIMAADLANTPQSGFHVQLCGDAHLCNFGGFASPAGDVVFDINDYDETLPGPWEWDLKRLATSVHIAGRIRGCDNDDCQVLVQAAAAAYRRAMHEFAEMPLLDVLQSSMEITEAVKRWGRNVRHIEQWASGARSASVETRDNVRFMEKLTHKVNGRLRITGHPPLVVPIEELFSDSEQMAVEEIMRSSIQRLTQSLHGKARQLLESVEYAHMARKVVGVGSVGLRSWIVLLLGKEYGEPLFLQFKESQASSLEPYTAPSSYANHAQRVVEGQRLLQAETDTLLGWGRFDEEFGMIPFSAFRVPHSALGGNYYVRQLWDWKISADVEHMPLRELLVYGEICGWTLARAHACSGDRIAIAEYMGKGPTFDQAIAEFSRSYAGQNERDYHALRKAVEHGFGRAAPGVR